MVEKKYNKKQRMFTTVGVPLTVTNILILVIMVLVFIQMLGLIFNWASVTLGPVFILLVVGALSVISVAIFKKIADGVPVTNKDLYAILVCGVVALLVLFFLREFVPEVFRAGVVQLQSVVGF